MELPRIEFDFLPDLEVLTGLFGSLARSPGHDDTIIIMMTYVYEIMPPQGMI
mgnify:CR=1 FL=1